MENQVSRSEAVSVLNQLIGKSFTSSCKYGCLQMYEFGFGGFVDVLTPDGSRKKVCPEVIHNFCRFRIIKRTEAKHISTYYEDTPEEQFNSEIKTLFGLCIKRLELSEKNDLWLDLGDYWVVFATTENAEESWRYFMPYGQNPHLVATSDSLSLQY